MRNLIVTVLFFIGAVLIGLNSDRIRSSAAHYGGGYVHNLAEKAKVGH